MLRNPRWLPGGLVSVLLAALVIISIWVPPWWHYRVSVPRHDLDVQIRSRLLPDNDILEEIGALKHWLIPPYGLDHDDPVTWANAFLDELVATPQAGVFDAARLDDVEYAGFEAPRTLLRAYQESGDDRYLEAALTFILEFADYERRAWLPTGFLWHDTALGVRSVTLSELWRHYRKSKLYDRANARRLLQHVKVNAYRLADAHNYRYESNHGTMQNIGLLHLALAFPELPGFDDLAELAISRQQEQMSYMFSDESIWLEPSAGYHRLATELVGMFMRYLTLDGRDIPADVRRTYDDARDFYLQLRAPDGSLPRLGDMSDATVHREPLSTRIDASGRALRLSRALPEFAPQSDSFYRDAGYSIWWSGADKQNQTVVGWTASTRLGHKHADELSMNLRTASGRWWTSVGYWPLHDALRGAARSWSGSNAPHLAGETFSSKRTSIVTGHARIDGAAAIALERRGPGTLVIRRQLVHVEPNLWLTIDSVTDASERSARTVWGLEHDVDVKPGEHVNGFELSKTDGAQQMSVQFLSQDDTAPTLVRGQDHPLAGWVEVNYQPAPASAFVVTMPSGGEWAAQLSMLHGTKGKSLTAPAEMVAWTAPDQWRLEVPAGRRTMTIERDGANVSIAGRGRGSQKLTLEAPPDASAVRAPRAARHDAAVENYHTGFANFTSERRHMSMALLLLLLAQECVFFVLKRRKLTTVAVLRAATVLPWLLIGVWLHVSWFVAS